MTTQAQPNGRTTVTPPARSNRETADLRPLLISVEQAARLLGVGRTTLYELVRQGEVTPVKIGRAVRFPLEEIEGFVARLRDGASSSSPAGRAALAARYYQSPARGSSESTWRPVDARR